MTQINSGHLPTSPISDPILLTTSENKTISNISALTVEPNKVTLSEEGKALLAALQQLDNAEDQESESIIEAQTKAGKAKAFTYGALGMDHPQRPKEPTDKAYTAGKYLSAAAKIGGLVLLLA